MNWKTTVAGLAAGAAAIEVITRNGGTLSDWKSWILPVVLAILGYLAKDTDATK